MCKDGTVRHNPTLSYFQVQSHLLCADLHPAHGGDGCVLRPDGCAPLARGQGDPHQDHHAAHCKYQAEEEEEEGQGFSELINNDIIKF